MSDEPISYLLEGGVARVTLDDGKANALSPARIVELRECLARAEKEASALLLVGREGRFCGGFDLATMAGGDGDAVRRLVGAGAELLLALYEAPLPVVAACTGHAVAAGALLLLASDLRIGASAAYKIGLTEVGIGMKLPVFGVELARERLSKRHFDRATCQAELYAPEAAVDAGFLDAIVPRGELLGRAQAEAVRLGGLRRGAFAGTKRRAHSAALERIRSSLEADLAALTSPTEA